MGRKMNWMQQLAKVIMQICLEEEKSMSTKNVIIKRVEKVFWSGRFSALLCLPHSLPPHTYSFKVLKNFVVYA